MSERDLFIAGLQISDPSVRSAWLDRECAGDAALRHRIDVLMQAFDKAGSLLESPAAAPAATYDDPVTERPGTVIGPYKLLEQIGEGGFGVVFLAEQTEPVRRKVALKVLKPGMDTRQVVARFEAERQALAIMDHPNIAKVHDGGATTSGRPYFVMELVQGVPITRYCDEHHLTLKQRLDLFLRACEAVQHAHQKGVIHRDLKPSNVLVGDRDDKPVLKVIDFGVAKAMGQQLTEKTLFTGASQMIGTPLYMSPEQAGGNGLDLDTRSDIYSLGAVLYELLTGTTPIDREGLQKAGYEELVRIIRDQEPPKPSTRLGTDKRAKEVRGELDWIVMKALEKDRNRRYETANGLAMDLQHYLCDEPVVAGPPSASYRLRKFVRRNKAAVAAVTVILSCLLAGIIGTSAGLLWAVRERDEKANALMAETKERKNKEEALAAETKARAGERQARDQAMKALRHMTDEVIEHQMARGATLTDENKAFLRQIIKDFEGFAAITADDADSRSIRAEGYWRVGLIRYRLGELKEAKVAYVDARAIYQQLATDFPSRPEFRRELARSHSLLGVLLRDTGHPEEAESAYAEARTIAPHLAANFPAEPEFRRLVAKCQINLGVLFRDTGRFQQAETAFADARAIYQQLAAEFPLPPTGNTSRDGGPPDFRQELATSDLNLAYLLHDMGRPAEAEAAYADARAIYQQLAAKFPSQPEFRRLLALSHSNLGVLFRETGRLKEAEAACSDALAIAKQLAADFPARPEFRQDLATSHKRLGDLLSFAGRLKEAEAAYADALAIDKQLAADFRNRPEFRQDLATCQNNLGGLLSSSGRPKEAETAFTEARSIYQQLAADFPTRPEFRRNLADSHNNLGVLFREAGRFKEAEAAFDDARTIYQQLAADFPDQADMRNGLADSFVNLALLCNQRRDFKAAKAYLQEALPHHQAALKANARNSTYRQSFQSNMALLVQANAGLDDQAAALEAAQMLRDVGGDPSAASANLSGRRSDDTYNAACALALCIPVVEKDSQLDAVKRQATVRFYGDQALAMLRAAIAQGYKDVEHMRKDTDLDSLRQRHDFQKLLAELEGKK